MSRRSFSDDSGITLVEVLVAILIFGVLGSVVTAGLVSATRSSSQTSRRSSSASAITTAVERLTRDIRAADPALRTATATMLVADVFGASTCRRVTWRVQGTDLQRQVQTYSAPGGAATNATAGCTSPLTLSSNTGFVPQVKGLTSGVTVFTYSDSAGATAATAAATKTVALNISASQASGRAPVSSTATVTLRNN